MNYSVSWCFQHIICWKTSRYKIITITKYHFFSIIHPSRYELCIQDRIVTVENNGIPWAYKSDISPPSITRYVVVSQIKAMAQLQGRSYWNFKKQLPRVSVNSLIRLYNFENNTLGFIAAVYQ